MGATNVVRSSRTNRWWRHGDLADVAELYKALATAPSAVTHGIAVPELYNSNKANLDITYKAAGACAFSVVVWGYKPEVAILDPGPPVTKTVVSGAVDGAEVGPGWTNLGTIAVSGNGATQQRESHQIEGVAAFSRLAAQIVNATGTPKVWADFGFSGADQG